MTLVLYLLSAGAFDLLVQERPTCPPCLLHTWMNMESSHLAPLAAFVQINACVDGISLRGILCQKSGSTWVHPWPKLGCLTCSR